MKQTKRETDSDMCVNLFAYDLFNFALFQVMSMLYPKIVDMFYFAGEKHSTPNCPVELRPDLNPSSGIQSYDGSDSMCLKPSHYNIPFWLNRLGPKFSEWSINAHEARPGHHIQVNKYKVYHGQTASMRNVFILGRSGTKISCAKI